MKINGETQLKDLIPEGYESSGNACMSLCIGEEHIIISIKKKEVKDFKWYVGEYMNAAYFNIKYKVHGNICDSFRSENFDKVPFEFKIGLLKFICDDLGVPFRLYLSGEYAESPKYETEIRELKSICPQEFLNSIFE